MHGHLGKDFVHYFADNWSDLRHNSLLSKCSSDYSFLGENVATGR